MSEKSINEDYIIREFTNADYYNVLKLWESTKLNNPERADNIDTINSTLKHGGVLFVLEEKLTKKIIGTAWITNDGRRLYLHHFCIHPAYQKKGFGSMLFEKCIEIGKKMNMQIKLEVHRENKNAINLYKKYKFKELNDYLVFILRSYE
ncbi:MAG: GNAT family N-acetyltransferase [Bacteroidales bacterium]|nr:GNAT family N-acetyltransferase [Bacteroidales bacterium]